MKLVTLISCLFLISVAESIHLSRRYRDIGHHATTRVFTETLENQFPSILVALLSQSLQKASYEEVIQLKNATVLLTKNCFNTEQPPPECLQPLSTVLLDEICHQPGLAGKYGFVECCSKTDPERNDCFLSHKNETPGFIPPFPSPNAEDICKEYQDNKAELLAKHHHEISRRHPFVKIVILFEESKGFEKVVHTCCQETDKESCFKEKLLAVKNQFQDAIERQEHTCFILKEFGKRSLKYQNIAKLSRRFFKANLSTVVKLAGDIAHIHEDCCRGDMLECLADIADVTRDICTHEDTKSTKVKDCCEKELLERGECLKNVGNDERPTYLLPTIRELWNKDVCQDFIENKNSVLEKFVYETGRRHHVFSNQLILRIGSKYEEVLGNCCEDEEFEECLGQRLIEVHRPIHDSLSAIERTCDLYTTAGDNLFQNKVLIHYTKTTPQLAFEELYQYSKKFTSIIAQCCKDDALRQQCAEETTELVLGPVCHQLEKKPLNKRVHECCTDSYEFRQDCFSKLGVDTDYIPGPFSSDLFTFHSVLCSTNTDDVEQEKQKLLVKLIKCKPTISDEHLANATVSFNDLVTQCCKAENHEECFKTEGPKLVEQTRVALGEN